MWWQAYPHKNNFLKDLLTDEKIWLQEGRSVDDLITKTDRKEKQTLKVHGNIYKLISDSFMNLMSQKGMTEAIYSSRGIYIFQFIEVMNEYQVN